MAKSAKVSNKVLNEVPTKKCNDILVTSAKRVRDVRQCEAYHKKWGLWWRCGVSNFAV